MPIDRLSRRTVLAGSAVLAAPLPALAAATPMTAAALLSGKGLPADVAAALAGATLLHGSADTPVTGIMLATVPSLAALRQAVSTGCNLVLSAEAPLYSRPLPADVPPFAKAGADRLFADPTYKAKAAFIAEHKLTIYRLPTRTSDEPVPAAYTPLFTTNLARAMGLTPVAGQPWFFTTPPVTLGTLVQRAQTSVGAHGGLRVIGDLAMPVRKVCVVPGTAEVVATLTHLRQADVLVAGDLREWEIVPYIADSRAAGHPKGLVAVGRILSEQPGTRALAAALRAAHPKLPVSLAEHTDSFWRT
jgi:putative NIF3 family GTP cyclohydrolase 1 type 2